MGVLEEEEEEEEGGGGGGGGGGATSYLFSRATKQVVDFPQVLASS